MTADFDEAGTAPLRAVIARAGGFRVARPTE